ncbi:MAG: acyl-CoA thioesterase [Salinarimonadaceae bacterium]|nr:MAG: acyl-CoA thioesterase [Salinarimonadaceae bacterium]
MEARKVTDGDQGGDKPAALLALEADPRVVVVQDVIRYADLDANGHVNNAVYATLSESGRVRYQNECVTPISPPDIFYVVVRVAIDFTAEAFYPSNAFTATWVERLGRTSITFGQEIYSGGRLVARAQAVSVIMDVESRRPTPLSDAVRDALSARLRPASEASG